LILLHANKLQDSDSDSRECMTRILTVDIEVGAAGNYWRKASCLDWAGVVTVISQLCLSDCQPSCLHVHRESFIIRLHTINHVIYASSVTSIPLLGNAVLLLVSKTDHTHDLLEQESQVCAGYGFPATVTQAVLHAASRSTNTGSRRLST